LRPSAFRSALALPVLLCAVGATAGAGQLARLNVGSFAMQADTTQPKVGVAFHVIFTIHVAQNVTALDDVILPPFDPLEILGDEQHVTSGANGTDYREAVTVEAHQPGRIAIAAARLDAIDARDGKPKQFLSTTPDGKDTLVLTVTGGAPAAHVSVPHVLGTVLSLIGGLIVVGSMAWLVLASRRIYVPAPPAVEAPIEQTPQATPAAETIVAVRERLRERPDRATAVWARARLWAGVGAPQGATLSDVLTRPQTREPHLRAALIAAERAAFTHDADLPPAIGAFVVALGDL